MTKTGTARVKLEKPTTTISMSKKTFDRLGTFGNKSDTWDEVLIYLMDNFVAPEDMEKRKGKDQIRRSGKWGIPS